MTPVKNGKEICILDTSCIPGADPGFFLNI